ncbi:MAG: Stk1 family PASTA domain-containing Ser/Thr kinase [Syntrophomonadaceae bacterium]|nr:Stk1 family PASTA domain-containing Ser/Thr kinase [Syntrophomonadaceae bacterium]
MIGKVLAGRYEIQGKLGAGGMAIVYRARCTWLDRTVTVKILRDELVNDEEFVRRFRHEAQAVAQLSHPNIVSVYDVGQDNGIYYIVMEYVDGQNLKELIRQKGKIATLEALDISIQICSALEHAHENNIIHRDIKPHNILITSRGKVKVTDFGIARAITGTTVTHPGKILGSVHYLSPEQARGELVGISSDLYSVGAVLYEMLTGRVPFEGESPISVALKHLQDPIMPPRKVEPAIPEIVEQIVLCALNKEPQQRFRSAREMQEALRAASRGEKLEFFSEIPKESKKASNPGPSIPAGQGEGWEEETRPYDRLETKLEPKRRKPTPLFWVLVIMGALGFFVGMVYLGIKLVAVPEVVVPNVQGKLVEDALKELQNHGVEGVVTSRQFNNEIPKERVISQKPLPEEKVKRGRRIELTVSQGAQLDIVPNVKGRSVAETEVLLGNRGFKVGLIDKAHHPQVAQGLVITQTPAADTQQPVGTAINLDVSLGPEPQSIMMPNLVSSNLEDAKAQITGSGLSLGNVTEEKSDQYYAGQIMRQEPVAQSPILPGSKVNLVVSQGPGPASLTAEVKVTVPKGENQQEVVITVEDLKGKREAYRAMHKPGEKIKVMVRYYSPARIQVLVNGVLFSEKDV